MKTILLSLFAVTPAFAASQTTLTIPATVNEKGICIYDAKLPFASFPDFSVFFKLPKANTWTQGDHFVLATVDELADQSYSLHLQPMPEFPQAGETCAAKVVKVLVR